MKSIILYSLFVAMYLILEVQGNCPHPQKDETLNVGEHIMDCIRYTCHADGHLTALGCPALQCEEQIGYQEKDLSKPYPDCCERPICANSD